MSGNAVIGALRVDLGLETAAWEDGLQKVEDDIANLGKALAAGLAVIAAGFTAGITAAVYRMEQMEVASRKVDQVLANTGNAANTSAAEIGEWADTLEMRTGRAGEEVMAVAANLASYGFGEEIFFRAIELADDMSAAWGGDLRQNMDGLARALENPEKGLAMLSARGITFTAEGRKMAVELAKAGKSAEAAGVLMDELASQVKGAAEAGFQGLTKSMANAQKALEEFFEAFVSGGGVTSILARGLDAVTAGLVYVTQHVGTLIKVAATAGVTMAAAFSPQLLGQVRAIAVAIDTQLVAAMNRLNAAVVRNPMGALAVGITAAATALTLFRHDIHPIADEAATLGDYMAAAWAGVVPQVQAAGQSIQSAARSAFDRWWEATRQTAAMIGEWTGLWAIGTREVADANSQAADETVKKWGWGIDETIRELSFLGAAGVATKDAFVAAFSNFPDLMKDVAARAMNGFLSVVEWAVNKIRAAFDAVLGTLNAGLEFAGFENIDPLGDVDLSGYKAEAGTAAADVAAVFSDSFSAARANIEGSLDGVLESWRGNALDLSATRQELNETGNAVRAFGELADAALGGGGDDGSGKKKRDGLSKDAIEAARIFEQTRTPLERYQAQVARLNELLRTGKIDQDTYNRAVLQAQTDFDKATKQAEKSTDSLSKVGERMGSMFSSAFQGLIDGTKRFSDVIGDAMSQLANMFLSDAFQAIFGGGTGGSKGGGLLSSIFGGIKLPGFANGGDFKVGGAGGIDSQVVAFRASPNEHVSITKPGQRHGSAGGVADVRVFVDRDGNWQAAVERISGGVAADTVGRYDRQLDRTIGTKVAGARNMNRGGF